MKYRPRLIISFLMAMALISPAWADPATSPDDAPAKDLNQLKTDAKHRLAAQWQNIPSLGEKPPQDVINFTLEQGRLIAHCNLPHAAGAHKVTLGGFPGEAVIRNIESINLPHDSFLMFEYHDFSSPDAIDVQDQVISAPNMVQVVRDVEFPSHSLTVTVMQSLISAGNDAFTLRVQDTTNPDDKPISNFVLTASTLSKLRLEHPSEFEQYIRPLFRDLGQERVFTVDPKLAWQIAGDNWKPPADYARRVLDVVAGFNSESYTQRESAQSRLAAMGEPAALCLMAMDRSNFTPEQKVRTDNFLHFYRPANADEVAALRSNPSFLLDCLDCDDSMLRQAVLEHLKKAVGQDVKFDVNLRSPERAAAIAKLRGELISHPTTEPATRR